LHAADELDAVLRQQIAVYYAPVIINELLQMQLTRQTLAHRSHCLHNSEVILLTLILVPKNVYKYIATAATGAVTLQ